MAKARLALLVAVVLALVPVGISAQESVVLEVWISDFNAKTQEFITEKLIPEFEAAHPHIKVNVSFVGWGQFYDKLYTSFAGGMAPDIFQGGSTFRGPAATQGFGLDITEYTENWEAKDDFYPGSWAAVHWEGRDYGIPTLTAPRSIIYRADMLAEVGLDPNAGPTYWDDVREVARRLTKVDEDGTPLRWGFRVPVHDTAFWIPLLWQAGGELTTPDGNEPLFNTPEGVEAATFYWEFYKEQSFVGPLPSGGIARGAYAMEYASTKVAADAKINNPELRDEDIQVGYPMEYRQQATAIFTDSFFVSSQTQHPDAAWEFLKFFAETDNITAYNETLSFIPPRRSSLYSDYVRSNPHVMQSIERVMPYGIVNPAFSNGSAQALSNGLRRLFLEGWTPEAAIQAAAAQWVPLTP